MKVIQPTTIVDAMLISSSVPETEHAAYTAGTTYALADRVVRNHRVWESLQASNTGHTPGSSPDWWLDVGTTNRWAMFDGEVNTQTSQATSIEIVIEPGKINALALLEVEATGLHLVMLDDGGVTVYDRTINLDGTPIIDGYTYFFEPAVLQNEVVLTDIPTWIAGRITITLTSGGTVKCGFLIAGNAIEMGDTQYGARIGIIDYSRKETDEFGVTSIVRRHFSKRMSAPVLIDNTRLAYVQRKLAALRSTPCLWVGSQEYLFSPLIVYGFYRDLSIDIAYPTASQCNLEIEGMI